MKMNTETVKALLVSVADASAEFSSGMVELVDNAGDKKKVREGIVDALSSLEELTVALKLMRGALEDD